MERCNYKDATEIINKRKRTEDCLNHFEGEEKEDFKKKKRQDNEEVNFKDLLALNDQKVQRRIQRSTPSQEETGSDNKKFNKKRKTVERFFPNPVPDPLTGGSKKKQKIQQDSNKTIMECRNYVKPARFNPIPLQNRFKALDDLKEDLPPFKIDQENPQELTPDMIPLPEEEGDSNVSMISAKRDEKMEHLIPVMLLLAASTHERTWARDHLAKVALHYHELRRLLQGKV